MNFTHHIGIPNDCSIVAMMKATGKTRREVEEYAKAYGYVRGKGLTLTDTVSMALDMGLIPQIKGSFMRTSEVRGVPAEEAATKLGAGRYLVFVDGHVMYACNGKLTNKNGCGDMVVTAVVTLV